MKTIKKLKTTPHRFNTWKINYTDPKTLDKKTYYTLDCVDDGKRCPVGDVLVLAFDTDDREWPTNVERFRSLEDAKDEWNHDRIPKSIEITFCEIVE